VKDDDMFETFLQEYLK